MKKFRIHPLTHPLIFTLANLVTFFGVKDQFSTQDLVIMGLAQLVFLVPFYIMALRDMERQ